jgi:hypothetical protein
MTSTTDNNYKTFFLPFSPSLQQNKGGGDILCTFSLRLFHALFNIPGPKTKQKRAREQHSSLFAVASIPKKEHFFKATPAGTSSSSTTPVRGSETSVV